ncbi:MAG TPA: hypothetical protein VFV66_37925 [Nonomuraea sp.]|nr:hypothetical protein [Nonomuraea sp.]
MVRRSAQAQPLALAVALAAVLAGCGGDDGDTAQQAKTPTVIEQDLGVDYRLANCTDWARGDEAERRGTVQEIAGFAGSPVGNDNGVGNTLNPDQAYALFENWCARSYAKHFKLYKLYVRAAAFTPPQQ